MSEYAKGSATAILSHEDILRRRDRNSFDSGYQAGVECHAELRAELLEALKAIFADNCFYHKTGDERAYRLSMQAIAKAEAKNV